jgi:lipopolysaccharide export system protein LptC
MSIAARTETAEQRSAIYASLVSRNRLVGILRYGLPAIGAIMLAGLLLQIYIGSLVPNFGFANIVLDRDNLVVEAPSYSGVGEDGTVYSLAAGEARAAIGNTDLINLRSAAVTMKQPTGTTFSAAAEDAQFSVSRQHVVVTGRTMVMGSNGLSGVVGDAVVDIPGESMVATGGADLKFPDGMTIKSSTMSYEAKAKRWTFDRVTVGFTSTPGEAEYVAAGAAAEAQRESAVEASP